MEQLLNVLNFILRYIFPVAALLLLAVCVISLFRNRPRVHKMAELVNTRTGEAISIDRWETSIGKSKSNDIVLDMPGVSRFHAVLTKKRRDWTITDTLSKNGVKLNGTPISGSAVISNTDTIEIGEFTFKFLCEEAISSATKQQLRSTAAPATSHTVAYAVLVDVKSRKPVYIKKEDVLIGRGDDCDIQILSEHISSHHAHIHRTSRGWALSDLDSTNGTKLNGRYITQPQLLYNEDTITFGDRVMIFYDE